MLWCIYTMEYYLALKRRKSYPLRQRDGPGEHYAKSIKPAGERQIPYDFTDVESNEQNKLTK